MSSYEGKVCIITGSAMGFGKGFSESVLKKGGLVTISDVERAEGLKTAKDFKKEYGERRVHFVECDVTSEEGFENLWKETEKYFGKSVDVLVNNAGVSQAIPRCLDINLYGVMIGTDLALQKMGKSKGGSGGIVINIASIAGLITSSDVRKCDYFLSKKGVVTLTKSLGTKEVYSREGILTTCLCPYFADTALIKTPQLQELIQFYGGRVLSVERVVKGFETLMEGAERFNGKALTILLKGSFFVFPIYDWALMYWMAFGVKTMHKLFPNMKAYTHQYQILFLIFSFIFVFLCFEILISLFKIL